MCYMCSREASPGVVPAHDFNAPNPPHNVGDILEKPGFLREAYEELVLVRKELSQLYSDHMKMTNRNFDGGMELYSKQSLSVSAMEREAEYYRHKMKLEAREAALMAYCEQYKYVASLGDAPATEDAEGEPTNKPERKRQVY